MKLLRDEMYPPALAEALRDNGFEATTVAGQGLAPGRTAAISAIADQELGDRLVYLE